MITEEMLNGLRTSLATKMSEKRYRHTVEVEAMVARLGALYAPDALPTLRAAALLHDITKEYSPDRHLMIFAQKELSLTREDLGAPKTFHARTAAAILADEYPEFAEDEVVSCIRWHTTGRRGMTLCEKLVYLADYIDLSRTFENCVRLRNFFFDAQPEKMSESERLSHLRDTLILSYDMTVSDLLSEGAPISPDTFEARNELVTERNFELRA
ncbi:MAG: bis(5'-nucleosyl)-tetraphosphatase (symmetrical) YqeK [Clostridia bacterium]|nr:bis(5'-nucleosyl)-tetraphosphatase (symmetrical) YqeK [Clostridia bacterium]